MKTIFPTTFDVTLTDRVQHNKHHPLFVLFTGLSGSGKTTWANALEKELFQSGIKTYLLDGDNLRSGLNKDLSFSPEDRRENLRRMAEAAKLLLDAGIVVLAAFIAPLHSDRSLIRDIVRKKHYIEIYMDIPLAVCEERDPKGLYKKARQGIIPDFTGVNAPYEAPLEPDYFIPHQDEASIRETVKNLSGMILNKVKL